MMATPVVLCGLSAKMGSSVASHLRPEYEVIQFITSVERARSEISTLVAGQAPAPDPDNVGSHDFSRAPMAVILGRGFESEIVQDIRAACGGPEAKLAWIRAGAEGIVKVKANPPDFSDPKSIDAYAARTVAPIKKILGDIKNEGKEGVDGVYDY